MNTRTDEQRFDDWFADRIWGNEDFKTCLRLAWNAALAQQVPADGEWRARDVRYVIAALQSTRDRMMASLTPKFGDALDGDFDAMLDAINELKRWATRLAATPQAPQPVVDSFTPEGLFAPGTDGNLMHEVGGQMVQDTYLNGVLLSRIPFASQPKQGAE